MSARKKKPALGGANPFGSAVDAILEAQEQPAKAAQPAVGKKVRASFSVPAELLERAKNAAYWKSGPPECLTLSAIVEAGLRHELDKLEGVNGGAFKVREGDLRPGRR